MATRVTNIGTAKNPIWKVEIDGKSAGVIGAPLLADSETTTGGFGGPDESEGWNQAGTLLTSPVYQELVALITEADQTDIAKHPDYPEIRKSALKGASSPNDLRALLEMLGES